MGLAACGGGTRDGRTGNVAVDACLHWTACVDQPRYPLNFSGCVDALTNGANRLPWSTNGVVADAAQQACLAAAGLDCEAALDCVTTPAPTPCPSPVWSCDGDTLTLCDDFGGSRVAQEDCAASGLHCVPVGGEAICGFAACDPSQSSTTCVDDGIHGCVTVQDAIGVWIGGVELLGADCGAQNADCVLSGSGAQCVGRGPSCQPSLGPIRCDGDLMIFCDLSGHEEQIDCAAQGLHCYPIPPDNPSGIFFDCADHPGLVDCLVDENFRVCVGTTLEYCDQKGNQRLNCKSLGYGGCADGHCTP